jgi:hypothetical protein
MHFIVLEIPSALQGLNYYEGISLVLWIIDIVLFFFGSSLLFVRARKEKKKRELSYIAYIAYGNASLCMGLTRIFFILGVYFPEQYDLYTIIGYITGIFGLLYWLYITETRMVKKTKNIFTIILLVVFIIAIIALFGLADRYLALDLIFLLGPASAGIIIVLYIYLGFKAPGSVRKKILGVLLGLFLMLGAQILDSEFFISAFPSFPLEIAPIIMMAGIFFFVITQLIG